MSVSDDEEIANASISSGSDLGFSIGKSITSPDPVNEVVKEDFRRLPSLIKFFSEPKEGDRKIEEDDIRPPRLEDIQEIQEEEYSFASERASSARIEPEE